MKNILIIKMEIQLILLKKKKQVQNMHHMLLYQNEYYKILTKKHPMHVIIKMKIEIINYIMDIEIKKIVKIN